MPSSLQHIELQVTDLAKARSFYRNVFSWTTEKGSDDVWFFNTGGNPGGAFVKVAAVAPGGNVTLFVRAQNAEEKTALIEKNGGRILAPKAPYPVAGHGFVTYFADPFGNRLGLWSPA